MATNYEVMLFDFGGVLTDGYNEAAYPDEISEKFGLAKDTLIPFLRKHGFLPRLSLGEIDEATVIDQVLGEFPHAREIQPAEITSRTFVPGKRAFDAVRQLRQRSQATFALASNLYPSSKSVVLNSGVSDIFDRLYISCDMGLRKPQPEYFQHILEDLGATPYGTLFIDDMEANIEAARDLGISTYHVQDQRELFIYLDTL